MLLMHWINLFLNDHCERSIGSYSIFQLGINDYSVTVGSPVSLIGLVH